MLSRDRRDLLFLVRTEFDAREKRGFLVSKGKPWIMTPCQYVRNIVSEGARVGEEGLGVGEDGVKDDEFLRWPAPNVASTSACESSISD